MTELCETVSTLMYEAVRSRLDGRTLVYNIYQPDNRLWYGTFIIKDGLKRVVVFGANVEKLWLTLDTCFDSNTVSFSLAEDGVFERAADQVMTWLRWPLRLPGEER